MQKLVQSLWHHKYITHVLFFFSLLEFKVLAQITHIPIERCNQTPNSVLCEYCNKSGNVWYEGIPLVLFIVVTPLF